MKQRSTLNKLGLMSIFLAVGSSNPIAIKFALNAGWPPYLLGTLRMSFIGLFFIIWTLLMKKPILGPTPQASLNAVIASMSKAISVVCFYLALSLIPANRVVMISTISPIINLVLIHFLLEHEKVTLKQFFGVGISLIGIVILLVATGGKPAMANASFWGDIFMLTSVIFLQGMFIFEKRAFNLGATPRQLVISTNVFSVLAFAGFFLLKGENVQNIPLTQTGILSYVYLITIAGVFLFYYRRWVASKLNVSYIASFSHLGKALALFYAALILGEKIRLISLVCFGIILLGTWVAARKETEEETTYEVAG
jgi:drug/metabolite transporter (DMT)-like permease